VGVMVLSRSLGGVMVLGWVILGSDCG